MHIKNKPTILVYHMKDAKEYADLIQQQGYSSIKIASTPAEAVKFLPQVEVIFCWDFPDSLIPALSNTPVRWIQSMGAGVDTFANHPDFPKHILLTRIVGQFGHLMAEYIFAYLLYLAIDIEKLSKNQKEKRWEPFLPHYLLNKKIGIAGLGSIGSEVVRKARAFDMTVYGLSYSGNRAHLVDRHFYPDEWKSFVLDLDYLILTLPLTPQTQHVIDHKILQAMKPTAILCNVGRGKLIVEQDLIRILKSGHLQAAILDVFEQEPLPQTNPLWSMENVYITPHLSGPGTPESIVQYFLENLTLYKSGQPLKGKVHLDRGY